jgi:DHA1 family bicyclomycin/chloramphenicol resistance-like MFS transporter
MNQSVVKTMVLITIILMDLLTGMEFDLFVPSFPELQNHFNLTPFWVEISLSINFIGYCLSLFFVGKIADHYGRKPIILIGLLIFVIGSIFCLCIPSYPFFLAGRFLQGIGIAAPSILSFLIIADSYPLKEQQFLLAMLNGSMNVAAASAPVIGSYVTLYFHWQGNFVALLCLGLITLAMTQLFIPIYKLPEHKETNSPSGYLSIFQSKPLMLLVINIFIMFVPYWIFVGISPILYMQNLGVSLAHFGFYQGILALVFALGSICFGLMIKWFDQIKWLRISNQIFILSLICISYVTFLNDTHPLFITLAILVFVIGQIIPSTILYPLCLQYMPAAKGRISALIQGGRLFFAALGLQITSYFYQGSFQNIGIIIMICILIVIITLFFVIKNRALMQCLK